MKILKINSFKHPDNESIFTRDHKFTIWLYYETCYCFSDKKKMDKFLADLNRLLNNSLVEINQIYAYTFDVYRQLWFFTDNTSCNVRINDFTDVERIIDKIYNDGVKTHRNHYVYIDFMKLIEYLTDILENMRVICTQKKIAVILMKIDNYLYNICRIKKEMLNFGASENINYYKKS